MKKMIVYLTMTAAPLASPYGGGGRAFARSERVLPSQSALTGCQLSQRESQEDAQINDHLPYLKNKEIPYESH